jgi:hypothetical protein
VSTATVETRETAWLTTVDSLPALLTTDDGPWEVIQAFDPVARRASNKPSIYVKALHVTDQRVANLRIRPQYEITLELHWPVRTPVPPIAETETQNLKDAADLVLQRVRGFPGDKTHGGRFLSAGEVPSHPEIVFTDPALTIPEGKYVAAVISYRADDLEING